VVDCATTGVGCGVQCGAAGPTSCGGGRYACGSCPPDGGVTLDAGRPDAGAGDAGVRLDGGPELDSGTPPGGADAGPPLDAGPALDAGLPADAGSPRDAGALPPGDGGDPLEPESVTPDAGQAPRQLALGVGCTATAAPLELAALALALRWCTARRRRSTPG
jgi:hypothetical protein